MVRKTSFLLDLLCIFMHDCSQSSTQSCRSLPSPYISADFSGFFKNLKRFCSPPRPTEEPHCYEKANKYTKFHGYYISCSDLPCYTSSWKCKQKLIMRNSTTVIAKIKGMSRSLLYNILWEVIHIYPFVTMWRNPCIWSLKSCQLHVDFTFQIWCWPCVFRNSI